MKRIQWKIVPAGPEHLAPIAAGMREADRREVWAAHRHTPEQALRESLRRAQLAWTCFVDGAPAFIWGVSPVGSLLSLTGAPWLLGTPAMLKLRGGVFALQPGLCAGHAGGLSASGKFRACQEPGFPALARLVRLYD